MTLRIGLTGGIGSGKTTVAKIFETLGIPVYYADDAAKRLMNEDEALKAELIRHFGPETYTNNELNRNHLSSLVFENPDSLVLLNSLVHPVTLEDSNKWVARQKTPYVIKEAALIFESDAWKQLDKVIGVSAPPELRLQRSMQRDNSSKSDIEARMSKQMNEDEKMKRCDYVITNDEKSLLIPQVITLHQNLLSAAHLQ